MEKTRTVAQDAAKGIMIIVVVLFHSWMMTFPVHGDTLATFNIGMAIAPFLLSSFFFYAGYNYVDHGRSFKEKIIRRAKQLLIPVVLCYVISIIVMSSIELIYDHNNIGATFTSIGNSILYSLMSEATAFLIGFPESGGTVFSLILSLGLLWFLYALFICSIFFYLLVKFTNKKLVNLIIVVSILLGIAFCLGQFVGVYLPYTCQCYPVVLAIMLTGSYLRQYHFLNREIKGKKASVLAFTSMIVAEGIIVGLCFAMHYAFGAVFTGSFPGGVFDYSLRGFDVFFGFAFSILGTYFVHTLCRAIKHVPLLGKGLQWIGNHSAVFYLFHPIFIVFAHTFFFSRKVSFQEGQALIYFGFTLVMLIITCLFIDYVIKRKHIEIPIEKEVSDNKDPEN